jgi:hypothetical protein
MRRAAAPARLSAPERGERRHMREERSGRAHHLPILNVNVLSMMPLATL